MRVLIFLAFSNQQPIYKFVCAYGSAWPLCEAFAFLGAGGRSRMQVHPGSCGPSWRIFVAMSAARTRAGELS